MDTVSILEVIERGEDSRHQNLIHADEMPIDKMTIDDFDMQYFNYYFQKRYGMLPDDEKQPLPRLLENMGLMREDKLTLCGALLFAKED